MGVRRITIGCLMVLVLAVGIVTRALSIGWEVSAKIRRHDHVFAVMCENGAPGLGVEGQPKAPFWPTFGRRVLGPFWIGPAPCVRSRKALAESCSLDHPEMYETGGVSWTKEVVEAFEQAQADYDQSK